MPKYPAPLLRRAKKVKLLLMDVDGVLTDGKIYYLPGPKGEFVESKTFHSRDGAGIRLAHLGGIKTGFITGRESGVVSHRAKELGIHYLYQAAGTKGHITKFQEAPCQKPLKNITIHKLRYVLARPFRFPPRGM